MTASVPVLGFRQAKTVEAVRVLVQRAYQWMRDMTLMKAQYLSVPCLLSKKRDYNHSSMSLFH